MTSLFCRWICFQQSEISRKEKLKRQANNIASVLGIPLHSKSYQRILNDLENEVIREDDILYKQ